MCAYYWRSNIILIAVNISSVFVSRRRRQLVCIQIKLVIYVSSPSSLPLSLSPLCQPPLPLLFFVPSLSLSLSLSFAFSLAHSIARFVACCRLIYHLALQAFYEFNELLTSNPAPPPRPRPPFPTLTAA